MNSRPSTERYTYEAIGPRVGPRKGAIANRDIARPRVLAENRSAVVPPALVRTQLPKVPPRKRDTRSVSMLGDSADIMQKMAKGK